MRECVSAACSERESADGGHADVCSERVETVQSFTAQRDVEEGPVEEGPVAKPRRAHT